MTDLLLRLFVKDYKNTNSPVVREKYGTLGSVVGIVVNIILSMFKYLVGVISNSVAITADAINNLSDAASCIVTLIGFKFAGRKPDKEHPFGHGRIEYIAALIVGFIVELMGYELFKSSIDKIRNPEEVTVSLPVVTVLCVSILGKVWLSFFNRTLGKRIDSPAMSAVAADSISDSVATGITLASLVLSKFFGVSLDGYAGIIVSLFILYAGFGVLKETVSVIIGVPPSKELVNELVSFILSHEEIAGIHDLIIHSYGATNTFATVHAEISADEDMIKAHDTIDLIEKQVKENFGIELVIHLDPIVTEDEKINSLKELVMKNVLEISSEMSIHDFRVVDGPTHTNLIFDVVVPYSFKLSDKELIYILEKKMKAVNERFCLVVTVDKCYI